MQDTPHVSPFDAIRKIADDGKEYWSARELYKILGYTEWRNFKNTVVKRAMKSCEENGQVVSDHFVQSYKMASLGSGSKRQTEDYHLTRYACYLAVMNGDPQMPVVAMGQQYFAVQTRRQEIEDELALANLSEDQKRLIFRSLMSTYNVRLAETAQLAGVIEPSDFATFQDHGYMGLYDGRRENDIHTLNRLAEDEKILDFMGSEELAANMFRATQPDAKMKRDTTWNTPGNSGAPPSSVQLILLD